MTDIRLSILAALFVLLVLPARPATFNISPRQVSYPVGGQNVSTTTSGRVDVVAVGFTFNTLKLHLKSDLADLQSKILPLLQSQLNQADDCGKRVIVQEARLSPASPSALLVLKLRYELGNCLGPFAIEALTRNLHQTMSLNLKLTPVLTSQSSVGIEPELLDYSAGGVLGRLLDMPLFTGSLKAGSARMLTAVLKKNADLNGNLPPDIARITTLRGVHFEDGGSGRLALIVDGELRASALQLVRLMLR